jgi:hypothetical protein
MMFATETAQRVTASDFDQDLTMSTELPLMIFMPERAQTQPGNSGIPPSALFSHDFKMTMDDLEDFYDEWFNVRVGGHTAWYNSIQFGGAAGMAANGLFPRDGEYMWSPGRTWTINQTRVTTPNTFLFTPTIDFGDGSTIYRLYFWLQVGRENAPEDNIGVYITNFDNAALQGATWPAWTAAVTAAHVQFQHIVWAPGRLTAQYANWQLVEVNLPALVGEHRICFRHFDAPNANTGGLMIDSMWIDALVESDITIAGVYGPEFGIVGTPLNFAVSLSNQMFPALNNFTIQLLCDSENILETVTVTTAQPGMSTRTHTISYTPTDIDIENFKIRINLESVIDSDLMHVNMIGSPRELQRTIDDRTPATVGNTTRPFNFATNLTVTQSIYVADELGDTGLITHLRYFYTGSDAPQHVPIELYMRQTNLTAFATGAAGWLRPETFQLVYNGTLTLPALASSVGEVWIELHEPFFYNKELMEGSVAHQNLVIMAHRPFTAETYSGNPWSVKSLTAGAGGGTNRSLIRVATTDAFNMSNYFSAAPTRDSVVPIVNFVIDRTPATTLSGVVTIKEDPSREPVPIAGVLITCNLTGLTSITNAAGEYFIPYFLEDDNDGITTYHTWFKEHNSGKITPSRSMIYNIELEPYEAITVRGVVAAGWNDSAIEGADVTFTHPDGTTFTVKTKLTETNGDGRDVPEAVFEILVPEDRRYTVMITATGFQPLSEAVTIPDAETIIDATRDALVYEIEDPFLMTEIFFAPRGTVLVTENKPTTGRHGRRNADPTPTYDLTWNTPFAEVFERTQQRNQHSTGWGWQVESIAYAHRYTPECRTTTPTVGGVVQPAIQGTTLYQVGFVPRQNPNDVTYYITITEAPAGVYNQATENTQGTTLHTQVVNPLFQTINQWSWVDLDKQIPLTGNGDYWVIITAVGRPGVQPTDSCCGGAGATRRGLENLITTTPEDPNSWVDMRALDPTYTEGFSIRIRTIQEPTGDQDRHTPLVSNVTITPNIQTNSSVSSNRTFNRVHSGTSEVIFPPRAPRTYNVTTGRSMSRALTGYSIFRITDVNVNYLINPPAITDARVAFSATPSWTDDMVTAPGQAFRYAVRADWNDYFDTGGEFSGFSAPIFSSAVISTQTVEVDVYVFDITGNPTNKPATVTLVRVAGLFDETGTTDAIDGSINFVDVPIGQYRLSASVDGHLPFSGSYTIYEDRMIEIYLAFGDEDRVLLFDSFETPAGFPENRWLTVDLDGDGYEWENFPLSEHNPDFPDAFHGNFALYSQSFCTDFEGGLCLYPDNWLITPPISFDDYHMNPIISFATRAATRDGRPNREMLTVYAIWDEDFLNIDRWSTPTDVEVADALKAMLEDYTQDPIGGHWPYGDIEDQYGVRLFDAFILNDSWEVRIIDLNVAPNLAMLAGQEVRLAFRHWQSLNNYYLGLDMLKVEWVEFPRVILSGTVYDKEAYDAAQDAKLRGEEPPVYAIEGAKVVIRSENNDFVAREVLTAADGRFTFPANATNNFRPGYEYRIEITKDGFRPIRLGDEWPTLLVPINGILNEGEPFMMGPALYSITGFVAFREDPNDYFMPLTPIVEANILIEKLVGTDWEFFAETKTIDGEEGVKGTFDAGIFPPMPDNRLRFTVKAKDFYDRIIEKTYCAGCDFLGDDCDPEFCTAEDIYLIDDDIYMHIEMEPIISEVEDIDPVFVTELVGNYPNPFNPVTTISFNMANEGNVKIEVFNIRGQHVTTLVNEVRNAGPHRVVWSGVDANNRNVGSGVYFYRMTTDSFSSTQKMLLIK